MSQAIVKQSERTTPGQQAARLRLRRRSLSASRTVSRSAMVGPESDYFHHSPPASPTEKEGQSLSYTWRKVSATPPGYLVRINVGGRVYQTTATTLLRYPGTFLTDMVSSDMHLYVDQEGHINSNVKDLREYYFDRSPSLFEPILEYYRTGELHFGHGICPGQIKKELEYWKVDEEALADCCWLRYSSYGEEEIERSRMNSFLQFTRQKYEVPVYVVNSDKNSSAKSSSMATYYEATEPGPFTSHLEHLNLILFALKESKVLLAVFAILFLSSAVVFGFLIRIFDGGIPDLITGLWFSMVTMTTIGYGDTHPRNTIGYILAVTCGIVGVFLVAMLLPLVTNNFVRYSTCYEQTLRVRKRKHKSM